MEKITKREMYEAIAEAMKTGECRYDPAEVISFCENEIDLLDKKAAKAKERAAAKAAEGDILTALVRAALTTDEFKSIADVTAMVAEEELLRRRFLIVCLLWLRLARLRSLKLRFLRLRLLRREPLMAIVELTANIAH